MTKQIFPFLICFIRELNLYSPLTLTLRPPIRPYLHPPPMVARFEAKNFIQYN
jgi:hypothetical protein